MSKEIASSRIAGRSNCRNWRSESNENEFGNTPISIPLPPPRTPLNSIQDPSQIDEADSKFRSESGRFSSVFSEKKTEGLDHRFSRFFSEKKAEALDYGSPRAVRVLSHSEPNSAQSTPVRSVSRVSNHGSSVACTSGRPPQCLGGRGGSLSKVSRTVSVGAASPWPAVEVPHFELLEDSSFWMDHNVQVIIRIRPISSTERNLQGYGRCLRQESAQTLTWLGHPETRCTFDHIACETISQEKLFKVAGLPMVENCMSGYNSCMFAYGQTGSGKTYTMMGEISEIDNSLSGDCGMTPRIFEYLFTRISAEEENRRDERLKYSCKCSFLEIYNEQITDLLEPSSSNLQLREDMKKGVYVENLKEYEVNTVKDVVKLLLQGAANRKMAATYMNSESSRSHSVFTCVIESCWEKDSMTHFRFGRLNLVDLAGSERQKSSGAEGERLKEAANINKSLSTLGLVIMTLVDVAHGKHRHVPYRDSRLTFLLQDSLGGNSKTAIIANVSPSICSANETLSTLKFAQRAKLIQNNAKVNEDAAGDVLALQQQIHQLKEQLTFLLNHQNSLRSLSCQSPNFEDVNLGGDEEEEQNFFLEGSIGIRNTSNCPNVPIKKMKNLEATLVGFLRREKKAEAVVKRLEAEIEHMNYLINRREEDGQRTKMLLRFREEKIRRLELLADGILSKDEYLKEENMALSEEIHLLQAKYDRHPELTRFALENIRLQEQIKMFQDFYEQGERETLLAEVSDLRNQLLEVLKDHHAKFFSRITSQAESKLDQATSSAVQERGSLHMEVDNTSKQLEECRKNLHACIESNVKLTSEVDVLRRQLENYSSCRRTAFHSVEDSLSSKNDPKMEANKLSSVVPKTGTTDSEDRLASCKVVRDKLLQIQKHHKDTIIVQPSDVQMDAQYLVEAMESQQIHLIEELDNLRHENKGYLRLLRSKCCDDVRRVIQHETHSELSESDMKEKELDNQDADQKIESGEVLGLKANLERMHGELVEARTLNRQYQDDQASQLLHDHELEQVREEIEGETVKTILCLQGDLAALQQEIESRHASESSAVRHSLLLRTENQVLQERLHIMSQENARLTSSIAERENELNALTEEWEKATFDLTSFLVEGCQSLEDASDHIESIVSLFAHRKFWIGEKVERAVKVFIEKEQTIIYLQQRLEEAQKMGTELQLKLNSLKGATLAISEAKQLEKEEKFKEVNQLKALLCEKMSLIHDLERKLENKECEIIEAEKKANETLIVAKSLYEMNDVKSPHESVANSLTIEHATEIVQWNNSNLRKDSISESFFEVKCPMNDIDEEPRKLNVVSVVEQVKEGIQDMYGDANTQALGEIGAEVEMARQRVLESEIAICASYVDTEKYLSALLSDILSTSSAVRKMVHDLNNDICAMKQKFKRLKDYSTKISCLALESPSCKVSESSKIEDQYSLLCFIRGEIAKTNKKLDALKASIDTPSSVQGCPVEVGDPAIVGLNMLACSGCKTRWHQPRQKECYSGHGIEEAMHSKVSSIDGYTSDIDPSLIHMGSEENKDELLSSVFCAGCSGRLEKQIWDIFPNRDSALCSRDHDILETQRPVNDLVCNDAIALYLKEEVESALSSLMTIHGQLSKLLANNSMAMCADSGEIDCCKSFGGRTDNCQLDCGHKEESNQLALLEMGQMLQRTDQGKEKAEASCCKTREMLCLKLSDAWFAAEDKMKQANNLLLKFEEAQETMREADLMLNELLRVNESTKFKMNWWKQVGEVLMTEKASLMEEVQQLRASIQMKDEQYESLEDQMLANVAEITALFSSLEVAFLRMQCNVEEEFKRIYSEIFSLRQELMDCIGNSRLCLESIWSQIMEKGFALFVLYQCHIGAVLEKFAYFDANSQYQLSKSSSIHCNMGNICVDANGNNMSSTPMNGTEKVTQIKHSTCGVSVTCDSWDVLHEFRTVQHNHVGSHVDADFVNFDSLDLLSDQNCCTETVARSEEKKLAPANGKKLIKEAITEQLNYLEKFCQELISLHGVSDGEKSADNHFGNINIEDGATVASISPYTCCSCVSKELQLQNPMIVSAIAENEVAEAKLGGVTVDRNTLSTDIQNLKTICTQMISLLDEGEDHPELHLQHKQAVHGSSYDGNLQCVQGRGIGLLDFPQMRTDCGHHAVEEMVKLVNKLFFVTGYIHSTMHVGSKNRYSASLLETLFQCICCMEEKAYCFLASMPESNFKENDVFLENLSLKRQLTQKEYILEGLLFDFRLLQESASNSKDIKDKSEKMMASLSKAQHELAIKTTQLDDILIRNKELEARLDDREIALSSLKYELEQAREALNVLCNDNTEFRLLLEDLCIKKTDVEEQLEEKVGVVKDLEKEVLRLATSGGDRFLSSIQVEDKFSRVSNERDQLQAEVTSLNDKLEMANALADENEAIAVEARQVSEASKIYAEQKEEEVKILECSVEELEYTINVLEKKVYEMGEEVERHRLMREDLELELQALRERVSTVENVPENLDGVPNMEQIMKDQMSRKIDDRLLELLEAKRYMKVLEKEKAAQAEEIEQCREYISELVLHAEAQASQYQQKYKTLETMVLEAKADTSISNPATSTLNRTDISSIRPRRSSSPFKCIASLVQQMNSEKDQELSAARRRMDELEALASTKQKEVCMLSARLLATENMTHDVIRDLLGVKLDMTNFANLIDQQQLQKFAEKAEHQKEESRAKEQEILMLRKQNNDFIEERQSWIEENNQRQADILAAQVRVEQLQLRDQLLTAQNEMLKMDKTNLKKKIAELDEIVKGLFGSEDIQYVQQLTKIKENDILRAGNEKLTKRLSHTETLNPHASYEHGWYHKTDGEAPYDDIDEDCRL